MANREIAYHEQYLCLPQCYLRLPAAKASQSVYMWERVNSATPGTGEACDSIIEPEANYNFLAVDYPGIPWVFPGESAEYSDIFRGILYMEISKM